MKLPSKTLERKLFVDGYEQIIGIDEVGMGCLAGPVVVCAVSLSKDFYKKSHKKLRRIRDSKMLLPGQREVFADRLLAEKDLVYAIAYSFPKTIDRLNIYNAARQAMKRAIQRLKPNLNLKNIVLVDGKTIIQGLPLEQLAIVKGDRKVFSIACASILAKVFRDKMMARYAKKFSGYGFEKHKGYGTKEHQTQLAKLGPCPIHRRSFAPVAKLI